MHEEFVELITSFNHSFSLILHDIGSIWRPVIIALSAIHHLVNPFSIYFAIQFLLQFKFEIRLDIGHMIFIKFALPALSTCSYSPTGRGQNHRRVFKSCDLLVQYFVLKFHRFLSIPPPLLLPFLISATSHSHLSPCRGMWADYTSHIITYRPHHVTTNTDHTVHTLHHYRQL